MKKKWIKWGKLRNFDHPTTHNELKKRFLKFEKKKERKRKKKIPTTTHNQTHSQILLDWWESQTSPRYLFHQKRRLLTSSLDKEVLCLPSTPRISVLEETPQNSDFSKNFVKVLRETLECRKILDFDGDKQEFVWRRKRRRRKKERKERLFLKKKKNWNWKQK